MTKESLFEYQIKEIIREFKEKNDIDLEGEELYEEIWKEYSKEFGRVVLERITAFSGIELFEE